MDRERLEELMAAGALGSLDTEELAELQAELELLPELAGELDELREAAALLGMAVAPGWPSQETRGRVMAAAAASGTGESGRMWPAILGKLRAPVLVALVVAAVVAVAALLVLVIGTGTKVDSLQGQVAELGALSRQQGESLQTLANWGDRGIRMIGTENAPDAYGYLLVGAEKDTGMLVMTDLPPLGSEQVFQLWLIRADERVSSGLPDPEGGDYEILVVNSPEAISEFRGFGMTIEPAGGSDGPTGPKALGSAY